MVKTTAIATVLLASSFAVAPAHGATVKDIAWWSGTRWGMSPDAITKVHPDMTIGVFHGHHWTPGFSPPELTAGIIPDVLIADTPFKVSFNFAGIGALRAAASTAPIPPTSEWRLASVDLVGSESACAAVIDSLTVKNGQPTKQGGGGPTVWALP